MGVLVTESKGSCCGMTLGFGGKQAAVKSTSSSVAPATLLDYAKWNKDFASV